MHNNEGRAPTALSGCTRMRSSTSFLMMLPTPEKTDWSSSASAASISGRAASFLRAARGFQASAITSALQS